MKKIFRRLIVIAYLTICPLMLLAQIPSKTIINQKIDSFMVRGEYASASSLMIDYSLAALKARDSITGLQYQIENCKLINEHAQFFVENGLTIKDFLNNYAMVMTIEKDFG